jgi:biopolymer transport protein ExbB
MGRLSERSRIRLVLLLALCLTTAYAVTIEAPLFAPRAHAQDGEPKPDETGKAGVAPKPPSGVGGWLKSTVELIGHMIKSFAFSCASPFLVIASIALVALCVLLVVDLRMGNAIPAGFVEEFTDTVNKRKFKEAYDMAKNDTSFLGRVVATGMTRLQYGIEEAREAAFNMVDSIRASKEQWITYLAAIASLGPLLGLVGTVLSMIKAFKNMYEYGMDTKTIAGDISEALVVTFVGVFLAAPAIFFHAVFRNRLNKIALETGNVADDLLTQMYHNSKKQGTAVPTVEAVPAAVDNRASTPTVRPK